MKKLLTLAALAGSLISAGASATLVSGSNLQNALNATGAIVDVNNDQQMDQRWVIGASTAGITNIMFEFSAGANSTAFGIYDANNASNKLQIYGGAASAGAINLIANSTVSGGKQFCTLLSMAACSVFSSSQFGFYLQTSSGTFYSDTALNTDNFDHVVAYQGNHSASTPNYINGAPWLANEYILAWEDILGGGDKDYDDFVVMVESVVSVPEPTTLGLLGLALAGLGLRTRKSRA